jgi:high mobility group protein B3
MAEYADYHQAMAQHAASLANSNQLHNIGQLGQIQMQQLMSSGLNLTVMSGGLTNNNTGQHHLAHQGGHHVMYANVQTATTPSGGGGGHEGRGGGGGGGHGSHKKQKKPKVNKDGVPAPKRATTAYINFTQWYREELKKSGRAIPKIGDFGKECAGKWNTMNEEDKKPFLATAAKDRDRYKREMAVFKPARDANKPKRPGTAFMLFMGDFRKEMAGKEPEGGVAALAKLGGERWRNMTEEDKRPYVEKQNEEKIRYEANMEDYRRKGAPQMAGPSPKQARLSTEGSENEDSDSNSLNQQTTGHHQNATSNMMSKQNQSTPSPASSSPPAQMAPSPSANPTAQQQQQQTAQLMTGYAQQFSANFAHPAATATANYNQAHAHQGNMAQNTTSYLPTGAGGAYSQLQGPYQWN